MNMQQRKEMGDEDGIPQMGGEENEEKRKKTGRGRQGRRGEGLDSDDSRQKGTAMAARGQGQDRGDKAGGWAISHPPPVYQHKDAFVPRLGAHNTCKPAQMHPEASLHREQCCDGQ